MDRTAARLPRSVKYRSMLTNNLPIYIFCGMAVCCAIHCGCRATIRQCKYHVLEGESCVIMFLWIPNDTIVSFECLCNSPALSELAYALLECNTHHTALRACTAICVAAFYAISLCL